MITHLELSKSDLNGEVTILHLVRMFINLIVSNMGSHCFQLMGFIISIILLINLIQSNDRILLKKQF